MPAENFFPLKRAVSKFEKYCLRGSHPSAFIATETEFPEETSFEQNGRVLFFFNERQ